MLSAELNEWLEEITKEITEEKSPVRTKIYCDHLGEGIFMVNGPDVLASLKRKIEFIKIGEEYSLIRTFITAMAYDSRRDSIIVNFDFK